MHRQYPLNAEVHAQDGHFGRSTHLVVDPTNEKVTHIVVKGRKWPQLEVEVMVPSRFVKETTPELILLSLTREEIADLEPLKRKYFSRREIHQFGTDPRMVLLWPYVLPEKKVITDDQISVPPGTLAVRRGARVRATDAYVGQVNDFVVDPETGYITHMVLREGLPWNKKFITIAISEIAYISEKVVYLKLDKKTLKQLPSVPIRHP